MLLVTRKPTVKVKNIMNQISIKEDQTMNAKKIYWLGVILPIFMILSCQKEMEPETIETAPEVQAQVFSATIGEGLTRTALSETDDGYEVLWLSGDEITIVDAASHAGTYQTTQEGKTADFSYVSDSGTEAETSPYKAYYPATIYNGGNPTLPPTQEYVAGNIKGAPMYAESSTNTLQFKNLGGIIRLNLSTTQSGKKVRRIVLSADSGMSGPFTISNDAAVISSGSEGVSLDCGTEGVAIGSTATPFYIAVPAGNYSGLKITVITTDGLRQTRTAKSTIKVGRNEVASITLGFNNLELVVVDLSKEEQANCYVVSDAGSYKIVASVAGNGLADLNSISRTLNLSGTVTAEILWATFGTSTAPGDEELIRNVRYENGYLYFSTGDVFQEGNALVGLVRSGSVIWSWHIWFTAADLTGKSKLLPSGDTVMDRNLGALSNQYEPDWFFDAGLYYQKGRKDPFKGLVARSGSADMVAAKGTRATVTNGSMSLAASIQNPTQLGYATDSGWSSTEKTIFDPCPPGWRMPTENTFIGMQTPVWTQGQGYTYTLSNGSTFWIPVSGQTGHGNMNWPNVGTYNGTWLWTSTSVYAAAFIAHNNALVIMDASWTGPTRCIRDESSIALVDLDDYTDLSAEGTANSYIVQSEGDYKFDATVRGNGAAALAGVDPAIDPESVSRADVIWATFGTATAPSESELIRRVFYKDGYLVFSTGQSFAEGNALVGVFDAAGNILWSWHIWFTDDNIEGTAQTYPGGAIFMDRNLGALSSDSSPSNYGLLYQWGRKDPFLNSKITNGGDFSDQTIWTPAIRGTYKTVQSYSAGSLPTVAALVSTPTKYTYVTDGGWTSDLTTSGNDLWSDEKTIFDPCPPGWKVPQVEMWDKSFRDTFLSLDFADPLTVTSSSGSYVFPNGGLISPYTLSYTYRSNNTYNTAYLIRQAGNIVKPDGYHYHYWASDGGFLKDRWSIMGSVELQGFYSYSDLYNKTAATISIVDTYNNQNHPDLALGHGANLRCVREECSVVLPSSVSLPASATVKLMDSITLTAETSPAICSYYTTSWTSSNTSVATVSENGSVFGLSSGTTTITVTTSNGKTASCQVTVSGNPSRKAVDMGLPSGNKWANMNLGATSPMQSGSYYAWGETSPRTSFGSSSGYQWPGSDQNAAGATWGSPWRTPSKADFQELMNSDYCTWTAVDNGTMIGYLVVSKVNGNAIFFPAGGHYQSSTIISPDTGYYWSSDYEEGWASNYGCHLWLYPSFNEPRMSTTNFYFGMNIRPVQ